MSVTEIPIHLVVGIVASLISAGLIWFFHKQILTVISSMDMSSGAALGWLMVFIMLGAVIVFALIDVETPAVLNMLLPFAVFMLLMGTIWRRQ